MSLLSTLDEYTLKEIYRFVFDTCLRQIVPTRIDDSTFYWEKNGKLHRKVGPAKIREWSMKHVSYWFVYEWFQNGQRHREGDQPAYICNSEEKYWFRNGELHRDGDQPAVIRCDGIKQWYKNGIQERWFIPNR